MDIDKELVILPNYLFSIGIFPEYESFVPQDDSGNPLNGYDADRLDLNVKFEELNIGKAGLRVLLSKLISFSVHPRGYFGETESSLVSLKDDKVVDSSLIISSDDYNDKSILGVTSLNGLIEILVSPTYYKSPLLSHTL